jgi:hypothetical protein
VQHVVYLSHGGPKYYDQTRFSVLSLLDILIREDRSDVRIVIFTDRPSESPVHESVSSVYVAPEDLVRFRGPLDYVHRVKLEVLRRAEAEIGLPFIYVDCDSRWLKIPDQQFAILADSRQQTADSIVRPTIYMHKAEGQISPTFHPQYSTLLHRKRRKLIEWKLSEAGPWHMWNSGTFGVPVGASGLFDKALAITDDFLLDVGYRIYVEQLALSLTACSQFRVEPFDDCLAHYWSHGSELPVVLQRFFRGLVPGLSIAQQARLAGQFQINDSELREIQSAPANRFRRWRAKIRNSFYKRGIDIRAFFLRRRRDVSV